MRNVFILFLFLYSCQEKDNSSKKNVIAENNQYGDSALNIVMKKFGLVNQQQNYKHDSNSLVFYCLTSFDSSFLIHFKKEENQVNVAYYVEKPAYYDVNDHAAQENYLLFFDGYSFTLDLAKWKSIKNKAKELLKDTSFRNTLGCRDCKQYGLSYNLKNKTDNGIKYEPFYFFLRTLFLDTITDKKR